MGAESPDWLGADNAKRAATFRDYKEKFGGVFDKDQKNLQESVYDELVAAEYATGVIAAADPSIKAFPVSGLLKIAFNETFSGDPAKAKKLMFDCLDYLESGAENKGDGKNINFVDVNEGVEVYRDGEGRWKLRVGAMNEAKDAITTARIDRFLFPKKEDVVATAPAPAPSPTPSPAPAPSPTPAPAPTELTAEQQRKIEEYKNDVLQKLKLIFGDTVNSVDQTIPFEGLDFNYEKNLADADWLESQKYFRINAAYKGNAIRLFIAPYGSSPVYKPDATDPEKDGEELADVDAIKQYITDRKATIDAATSAPDVEPPAPEPAPEPAPVEPELTAEEQAKMAENKAGVLAKLKEFFGDTVVSLDQTIAFEELNFKYENNLTNVDWVAGEGYFQLSAPYKGGKILLLIYTSDHKIYQQSDNPDVAPNTELANIENVTAYVLVRKTAIDEAVPIAKERQEGVLNRLKEFGARTFDDVITIEGLQFKRGDDDFGSLDVELWGDGFDAFQFEAIYKGEVIHLYVDKRDPYDFYSDMTPDGDFSKKDAVMANIKAKKEEIDRWESTDVPARMAGITAKIIELGGTDLKSPLVINGLMFSPHNERDDGSDGLDTLGAWMNEGIFMFKSLNGIQFGITLTPPPEFFVTRGVKIEPNDKTGVENYVKVEQRKIGVKEVLKGLGVDTRRRRSDWSTQLADLEFKPMSGTGGLGDNTHWLNPENKFWMISDYKGVELEFGVAVAGTHDLVNGNREKISDKASLEAYIEKRKKAVDDWEKVELPKVQEIVLGNIKALGGEKWGDKITIEDVEFSQTENNGGLNTAGKWMKATRSGENYSFYNFRADYKGVPLWIGVSVVKPGSFCLWGRSSATKIWQGEGTSELKSQIAKLKEEIDKEKPAEAAK